MSKHTNEYWFRKLELYFKLHPRHWEEWKWRLVPYYTRHDDKAPEWDWCKSCPHHKDGCIGISNRLFAYEYKNQIFKTLQGTFPPGEAFCVEWIKYV